MKVSIITVTYNSGKYLEDCILSVIRQKNAEVEHIIIDGKSTDNTMDIVRKYQSSIASAISETDRGMYDAINKGMAIATGDVIGILNSDDMLDGDDVIASIVREFESRHVGVIYGDLEYVGAEDTNKIIRIWKGKPYKRSLFHKGWMPAHPTFYIKRNLVAEFGGYESHYFTAADYEFMARYLFHHRVSASYLPKL
ncbi:MAG: glycosyltransferase, partial [Pedobacter sp.]